MKRRDWIWLAFGLGVFACITLIVVTTVSIRLRKPATLRPPATAIKPATTVVASPELIPTDTPGVVPPTPSIQPTEPPAFSEPSGKIVFTCQISGDQICIMNADGSDWKRLTFDPVRHWYASLAPDGNSVVYSAFRATNVYEIYEIALDGSEPVQLTDSLGVLKAPEISPDGKWIVFGRGDANGHESVWVMRRDGSHSRQLYGPPLGDGWDPSWSPDGNQVLFASVGKQGTIQLFVINADGSGLQQVSNLEGIRGRSDWSPDGTVIGTYAGSAWLWELFFMSPDGSNLRQVTEGGSNLAPSFSPDSQWAAFTSYWDNYEDPLGCEIYIIRIDGSERTRLTYNTYCDYQPRWGP